MWEFLKFWRRPAPPTASIGIKASAQALKRMIELLPDERRIGVVASPPGPNGAIVGVIEVDRAVVLLRELEGAQAIIVADLL